MNKFRDWLTQNLGSSLEVKPNSIALEIIGYLAYETVAEVRVSSFYEGFTAAVNLQELY